MKNNTDIDQESHFAETRGIHHLLPLFTWHYSQYSRLLYKDNLGVTGLGIWNTLGSLITLISTNFFSRRQTWLSCCKQRWADINTSQMSNTFWGEGDDDMHAQFSGTPGYFLGQCHDVPAVQVRGQSRQCAGQNRRLCVSPQREDKSNPRLSFHQKHKLEN